MAHRAVSNRCCDIALSIDPNGPTFVELLHAEVHASVVHVVHVGFNNVVQSDRYEASSDESVVIGVPIIHGLHVSVVELDVAIRIQNYLKDIFQTLPLSD
ncbi:MAG: hypothetical protein MUP41_16120 [Desulfobacterales bacterium]|nr:hypothetical protein [Desulfobacterales bacterium]